MKILTKTIVASACTLLLSLPALGGASLDTLLNGGSLFSGNGQLEFSDFEFTPIINAPSAMDIEVITLDDGLLFGSPIFTFSGAGIIDFNIAYKVAGVGVKIGNVNLQSTGSATGTGQAGVFEVIEDERRGIANDTNVFTSGLTISKSNTSFDEQDYIYVRNDVFANPKDDGTAGLSDFSQTFGTTGGTPTAIPTPTAALAGMALLGVISLRRRRNG